MNSSSLSHHKQGCSMTSRVLQFSWGTSADGFSDNPTNSTQSTMQATRTMQSMQQSKHGMMQSMTNLLGTEKTRDKWTLVSKNVHFEIFVASEVKREGGKTWNVDRRSDETWCSWLKIYLQNHQPKSQFNLPSFFSSLLISLFFKLFIRQILNLSCIFSVY